MVVRSSALYLELFGQGGWFAFEVYNDGGPSNVNPRIKYLRCPGGICDEVADEPLDPLERFWRFRADGTAAINWEVSKDAIDWRIAATSNAFFDLSRTTIVLGAYNLDTISAPVVIDGLFE